MAGLLSCQPTVTVFLETVPKDITGTGLKNIINQSGLDILDHRLRLRNRERYNQAYIYLASLRDAKLLVKSLERAAINNLSPRILTEDCDQLNKTEESAEVFVMNQPFVPRNKIGESKSKDSKPTSSISLTPSPVQSQSSGSEESQLSQQSLVMEEINLHQPVDDETFRARFEERMKQKKKDQERSNELAVTKKVDKAEALNVSTSSEDSEPPFYRDDDDGWNRAEDSLTSHRCVKKNESWAQRTEPRSQKNENDSHVQKNQSRVENTRSRSQKNESRAKE